MTEGLIKRMKGDITLIRKGVLIQGVNCQGKQGTGLAKAMRDAFPKQYDAYMQLCASTLHSGNLLGSVQFVDVGVNINQQIIANIFSQQYYGYDGGAYADLNAIKDGIVKTISFAKTMNLPVYCPAIGAGLGGLQWEDVERVITDAVLENPVDFTIVFL